MNKEKKEKKKGKKKKQIEKKEETKRRRSLEAETRTRCTFAAYVPARAGRVV